MGIFDSIRGFQERREQKLSDKLKSLAKSYEHSKTHLKVSERHSEIIKYKQELEYKLHICKNERERIILNDELEITKINSGRLFEITSRGVPYDMLGAVWDLLLHWKPQPQAYKKHEGGKVTYVLNINPNDNSAEEYNAEDSENKWWKSFEGLGTDRIVIDGGGYKSEIYRTSKRNVYSGEEISPDGNRCRMDLIRF
jgi:hypothetical protein